MFKSSQGRHLISIVRSISKTAILLTICHKNTVLCSAVFGGRPNRLRGGRWGEITNPSASVTLLEYRNPFRSYWGRVASVHMLCLADCLTPPLKHNSPKSLHSFYVTPLPCP